MKSFMICSFFLLPLVCEAQFANTAFFKVRKKILAFSTASQTVYQGNCSGAVTVQSRNGSGVAQNVTSATTITLTSSATTSYFSDAYCRIPISSASILNGQSTTTFYFSTSVIGTNTITAAATGFQSGTQDETIQTNPFIWTGAGGDANWTSGLNWQGGTPPNNTQVAVFNDTCNPSNCSPIINSNMSVLGIRMEASFVGTITQGAAATVTVLSSGYLQEGGTFIGSTNEIAIVNSIFSLGSGTFTSTSGTLRLTDSRGGYASHDFFIVKNPGSFIHNNGTVYFNVGSNNQPNLKLEVAANNPLNHMRMSTGASDGTTLSSVTSPSRPIVLGTATLEFGALRGPWELQGNLVFGSGYGIYLGSETAQFFFTGNADQVIDNTAGVTVPKGNVTVNKGTTSKLTLLGDYVLPQASQTLTFSSGRIDLGSYALTVPSTLSMASGTEIYLNAGVLKAGGTTLGPGAYGSGTILSGAAP